MTLSLLHRHVVTSVVHLYLLPSFALPSIQLI